VSPTTISRHIRLEAIDTADNHFLLNPFDALPDEQQVNDLQQLGLYIPPLLQENPEGRYRILAGFATVEAASTAGMEEIVSLVLAEATPPEPLFTAILRRNLMAGPLSVMEQALFLDKVSSSLGKETAVAFLPRLGYRAQHYILGELTSLLALERPLQEALHRGSLHLRTGKKLLRFSAQDQQTILELVLRLQLGTGKQQKLVDSAWELSRRESRKFTEILAEWPGSGSREAQENRPQLAASLLAWLHTRCFPRSSRAEEEFRTFCQRLDLPPGVHLQHTQAFEDDRLVLSITFADRATFLASWPGISSCLREEQRHQKPE